MSLKPQVNSYKNLISKHLVEYALLLIVVMSTKLSKVQIDENFKKRTLARDILIAMGSGMSNKIPAIVVRLDV